MERFAPDSPEDVFVAWLVVEGSDEGPLVGIKSGEIRVAGSAVGSGVTVHYEVFAGHGITDYDNADRINSGSEDTDSGSEIEIDLSEAEYANEEPVEENDNLTLRGWFIIAGEPHAFIRETTAEDLAGE